MDGSGHPRTLTLRTAGVPAAVTVARAPTDGSGPVHAAIAAASGARQGGRGGGGGIVGMRGDARGEEGATARLLGGRHLQR